MHYYENLYQPVDVSFFAEAKVVGHVRNLGNWKQKAEARHCLLP